MHVKIIPHSSVKPLLTGEQDYYMVDVKSYNDLIYYLKSMHPKFKDFMCSTPDDCLSPIAMLDKDYEMINPDGLIRAPQEGDVVYLCPTFAGEKGAGLKVFAAIALFVAVAYTGGFAWVAAGGTFTGLQKVAISIGLALISSALQQDDGGGGGSSAAAEPERRGSLFGSLAITADIGTRTPLHFGRVRTAGHLISGYKEPIPHGVEDTVLVSDLTNARTTPTNKNTGVFISNG